MIKKEYSNFFIVIPFKLFNQFSLETIQKNHPFKTMFAPVIAVEVACDDDVRHIRFPRYSRLLERLFDKELQVLTQAVVVVRRVDRQHQHASADPCIVEHRAHNGPPCIWPRLRQLEAAVIGTAPLQLEAFRVVDHRCVH